ncbi:tellurite resistance TerB C-terminal domain-containing protein [Anaerococcus marasmi]|uniref:tellurite resistance TerB C-terminal domain-containing protein n=1 Tax=Anaerococcus marasmi TaxID=2057797 RepID=UPI000CF9ED7D|nr:tellurite resistance TerB C-terminal domain-containing protein [Anaerococcus marasmi]
MKIDDVVDLIDGLLKDLSTIDKKDRKKTYKRKLGKVEFNFHIEDKKKESPRNVSYKDSDNYLGFWSEYKGLLDKLSYKREDMKLIGQVNRRFNQVWSNKDSRDLVVEAYLTILKKALDEKSQDTEKIRKYTSPYTLSESILEALLLVTEKKFREYFWIFAKIDSSKQVEVLEKNDSRNLLDFFLKELDSYYRDIDVLRKEEIFENYLLANPNKLKDWTSYILEADISKQISFVEGHKDLVDMEKLSRNLSNSDFPPTKALGFYYLFNDGKILNKDKNKVLEIIHEENYDQFIKLIETRDMSIELIDEILRLDKKPKKRIQIDGAKLSSSRKDLHETVSIVEDFLADSKKDIEDSSHKEEALRDHVNINEYNKDDKEDEDISISEASRNFLKLILKNGSVREDVASEIALEEGKILNSFIGDINDELFDYIDDQTLVNEDGKIIIDSFYLEMIKEIIDGKD